MPSFKSIFRRLRRLAIGLMRVQEGLGRIVELALRILSLAHPEAGIGSLLAFRERFQIARGNSPSSAWRNRRKDVAVGGLVEIAGIVEGGRLLLGFRRAR